MIWIKKNLLFTVAMVVLGAILAVEVFMILGQRGEARRVEAEFRAKVDEHRRLASQEVLPHSRNVQLTAAEIDRRREEAEIYAESLRGGGNFAERIANYPATQQDAYFDITGFVTEYRERAERAVLDPSNIAETRFGFDEYVEVGPPEAEIPAVFKQRLVVAHILDQLFEARPQSFVSIRRPGISREPENATGGGFQRAPAPERVGGFRLSPQLSVAIPEVAETRAYQVEFTGRTATLRTFLNNLSSAEMPLIVRSIQVAPGSEAELRRREATDRRPTRRSSRTAPTENGPAVEGETAPVQQGERIPLVADNLSRFIVSMEYLDIKPMAESNQEARF